MSKSVSEWKISKVEGTFTLFENDEGKIIVKNNEVVANIFKSQSICTFPEDVVLKTKDCTFVISPQNKEIKLYTNKE